MTSPKIKGTFIQLTDNYFAQDTPSGTVYIYAFSKDQVPTYQQTCCNLREAKMWAQLKEQLMAKKGKY